MEATNRPNRVLCVSRYSRADVLRVLRIREGQLASWERAKLVSSSQAFSFEDLSRLRTLRDLQAKRLSVRSIQKYTKAMQTATGAANALLNASAITQGSRMIFRHGGALVDPLTRQLAFDFGQNAGELQSIGTAEPAHRRQEIHELFLKAVRLEESETTRVEATHLYEAILCEHAHAPSAINLGTIRYGQRRFLEAEQWYRRATEADPEYALAFFDLGNVLDEMKQVEDAIAAYRKALALVPNYADAHYNLALAYERKGERRRALRHWLMYVRLDPVGPWANHAKDQAKKILTGERLTIVSRRGRLVPAC